MEDLANVIVKYFPQIAALFTKVVFVVFLVLNVADDYDKIKEFIKKIFNLRKHIDSLIYVHKRKQYNKTLYQKDYLDWQKKIMDKIYENLIEEKNQMFKETFSEKDFVPQIKFSNIFFDDSKNQSYEAVTLILKPIDFPFKNICPKDKMYFQRKKEISEEQYPEIQKKYKKIVKKYYRLIKQTIRYPKRLGFMLTDIVLDPDTASWYITAYSGTYENNLKTSHILEYELYQLFQQDRFHKWNIADKSKNEILEKLQIRKYIHSQFAKYNRESDVLTSGKYRSSLLGVQMFVMVKNHTGSYDALRIRRSTNVAAKPGFLQFIPSGGFEAMNDCTDYDSQWDNYSITKAVFRELLEECFGQDEDDKATSGNNVSPDRIYSNQHISRLVEMLESDSPKAHMQLLGTSMNLVGLRQELSFILRVDDSEFASQLIGNYESKTTIHLIDIKNLEKKEFWEADDLIKLNCTSAGLFELVRNSSLYRDSLCS